jgi:hypothetical protein
MLNPYINQHGSDEEKELMEDLAIEMIQFAGWDVTYIPRENFHYDPLLGTTNAAYTGGQVIEAILEDVENIDENHELYSSFGIRTERGATFVIAEKRFKSIFTNGPAIGDIVFLQHKTNNPLIDVVWEVRSINSLNRLQFGAHLPVLRLQCRQWENRDEDIESTNPAVAAHGDYEDRRSKFEQSEAVNEIFEGLADFDADNPFSKTF